MLVPKLKADLFEVDDQKIFTQKYFVYDTEKDEYIEGRLFKYYDSRQECQEAIDLYNSLSIVAV